jgi:hypothetical protein
VTAQAVGQTAQQLGTQARTAAAQLGQAGAQAAGQAKEVAHDAAARASSLAGDVTERVTSATEAQKNSLADRLDDMAKAVHRSGEQLEGHQDFVAHLVERGAAELSVVAQTLRTNDLRSLMSTIDDLARRQPALFAGASLAAGFALARVGRVAVSGMSRADLPNLSQVMPQTAAQPAPAGAPQTLPAVDHERG